MKAKCLHYLGSLLIMLFAMSSGAKAEMGNSKSTKESAQISFEEIVGPEKGQFNSIVFDPVNAGVVYSANVARQIFKSIDNGQNWTLYYSASRGALIGNLRFANPNEPTHLYFLVMNDNFSENDQSRGLYIIDTATDEIAKVIQISQDQHLSFYDYDLDPQNPQTIVVLAKMTGLNPGSKSTAWKSYDEGNTFSQIFDCQDLGHKPNFVRFSPHSSNTIFLGMMGENYVENISKGIYRSNDGGQNWIHSLDGCQIDDIEFIPEVSNHIFAVGLDDSWASTVYITYDNGDNWDEYNLNVELGDFPSGFKNITINPLNYNNVWITNDNHIIYSYDGGESWTADYFDYNDFKYYNGTQILFNPFNSHYVGIGNEFGIYQTYDNGETWNTKASNWASVSNLSVVKFPNEEQFIYYQFNNDFYKHNLHTGEVYDRYNFELPDATIKKIFTHNAIQDRVYLVASSGWFGALTLYKSDDNLSSLPTEIFSDWNFSSITKLLKAQEDDLTYWLVGSTGYNEEDAPTRVIHTRDGFETIEEISITGNDEEIVRAIHTVNSSPGVLWAAANTNFTYGVFRSADYGQTWESRSNGLPEYVVVSDIAINPFNPNVLVAALSEGNGLYLTINGGESWKLVFDEFECGKILFSNEHDGVVIAQQSNHYPALAYSYNGGENWEVIPYNFFLDASYNSFELIDSENSIDIYLTTGEIGIVKYNFSVPQRYTATFSINNEDGEIITDAIITFNNVEHSSGLYVFNYLFPADYSFSVSKEGYVDYIGNLVIIDENVNVNVVLENSESVGIPSDNSASLVVYPNPVSSMLNIKSDLAFSEIKLVNLLGQVVFSQTVLDQEYMIDVSKFDNGLYFLKVNTLNGVISKKVIVKK